jgi:hypothetical protein
MTVIMKPDGLSSPVRLHGPVWIHDHGPASSPDDRSLAPQQVMEKIGHVARSRIRPVAAVMIMKRIRTVKENGAI